MLPARIELPETGRLYPAARGRAAVVYFCSIQCCPVPELQRSVKVTKSSPRSGSSGYASLAGEKPLLDHFIGSCTSDFFHQAIEIPRVGGAARARPHQFIEFE